MAKSILTVLFTFSMLLLSSAIGLWAPPSEGKSLIMMVLVIADIVCFIFTLAAIDDMS